MFKFSRFRNTIAKKHIIKNVFIGLIIIICINLLMPSVFFSLIKPYLVRQASSTVQAASLKQSFIWSVNRLAYQMEYNKNFLDLLEEYYNEPSADREKIRQDMNMYFPVQYVGNSRVESEPGDITAVSYLMVATGTGDAFFNQEVDGAQEMADAIMQSKWYQSLDKETLFYSYSPVISIEFEGQEFSFICFIHPFFVDNMVYMPIMIMNFNDFLTPFNGLEEAGFTDYLVMCNDEILYQNIAPEVSRINIHEYADDMFEGPLYEPVQSEQKDGMDFVVLSSHSQEGLYLAVHTSKEVLMEPYTPIMHSINIFISLMILCIIIINSISLSKLSKRFKGLNTQMTRLENGEYDVVYNDNGGDEITNIARTFNRMASTIKQDLDDKIQQEKREQQMRYNLMVSAIDSHFIYNTLDTITFLAEMNRCKDIVSVNNALIDTLKDRLKMKSYRAYDSIQNEKKVLEQYMLIQGYLCHNQIEFQFHASDQDMLRQIPKNVLQPLVENAIKHGILPHKDEEDNILDGKIEITVACSVNTVTMTVSDNGVGMDEETIRKFFKSSLQDVLNENDTMEHIGVHNVRMRLSYLYEQYQLDVKSAPGVGTVISIQLPLKNNDQSTAG